MLMLLEAVRRQRFADLTVGLLEGWWAFTDTAVRKDYALVSEECWTDLLRASGFVQPVTMPGERR